MSVLALQLVQHRVPSRRLDVAPHPAVLDNCPRQQAHRQRMPAVGRDRLGDLGPCAFYSRGLEEAHHVVGREVFEALVAAAREVDQLVREQTRGEQHSPGEREGGRGLQELGGAGVDAVVVVPASLNVALIRGAVAGVGAHLALEAVEDEQDAALLESAKHDFEPLAVGKLGARVIRRPDISRGPVEEGAEVRVPLVERPEEHALRAPVPGDAEFFRVGLRVAGRWGTQHVGVQPVPGQSRLAHASNSLDHTDRPRASGEPLRQPPALGDAPGEVGLQRVRVNEVGISRPCSFGLAFGLAGEGILAFPVPQV